MKTISRILFFFLLVTQICFAQWEWQNPLPQGNTLNDVCFVDENTGWAVGSRGTLLHTIDGGTTWISRNFETGLNFKSLSFVNQDCGWFLAVGDVGYNPANRIYKTTNGGADWFIQSEIDTIGLLSEVFLSSIFFVNVNVGWAISEWENINIILKTTNGGIDWIDQSYAATLYRDLTGCYFIDENTGWILGSEFISPGCNLSVLKTTNGGNTWVEKQIPDTGSTGVSPGAIFFINANLGWATSSGDLLKTTDGGLSWSQQTITGGILKSICFLNEQAGYAVGSILDGGQVLKTTDGGTSWNEKYFDEMSFSSVFFANSQKGFIVGHNGEILKTIDSGESWIPLYDNFYFNFTKICMVDALNGWAAGDARASSISGRIVKTTDGGNTWNLIQHPEDSYPTIFFINSQIGWIGGLDCGIWKTTDSGLSWIHQTEYNIGRIEDIFFLDQNYGWAVSYGKIFKTTNGGEVWTSVSTGTQPLYKVFFINENIGWVIGTMSVAKTTDGGANWLPLAVPNGGWLLSSIYFIDAYNGWISGNAFGGWGSALFSTNDGGINWITQFMSNNTYINELEFLDDSFGYFIGIEAEGIIPPLKSVVYKTTNGGVNWIAQTTGTHQYVKDISFSDVNNGWVVGAGGTILHTTNGGVVPVELSSFTAEALDQKVILRWTTATELNNNGFEIQRKVAESEFATIGFVRGEGSTTNQKEYSYIDKDLVDGKYFYRLKQVDYNGTYEYSNTIEVDVRSLNEYSLEQNYPNPFNPTTTIGYVLKEKTTAKLILLNAIGEQIAVLVNEEQDKGFHKVDFNATSAAGGLSSGVYFYQLKAGDFVQTKKMILLK